MFLHQLCSINYPSLRDNNTLRRVLVSEVLYWAEKLTGGRVEERQTETAGGVSETEEEQTGERLTAAKYVFD